MDAALSDLIEKIRERKATVGVIGLGYVGLPVVASFAEAGFRAIGVDLDNRKVETLRSGGSYLNDVPAERTAPLLASGNLVVTTDFEALGEADAVLICVPTPITEGAPDLSLVVAAGGSLAKVVKPGAIVVLESTTYPGSTDELLQPILESSGLVVGTDLFLAFSPERIDPGNANFDFTDIPKIVGGVDESSTKAAAALYEQVVPKVVSVSSSREAELAKLLENTFRHVNIALMNELAVYAHDMGIDIWEAIEAAATKPFGFMPFWPGPGWGGHCIPLDPSFLSWRVRRDRAHEVRFVELAQAVNSEMPRYVVERISLLLNDQGLSVRGAKILGIGVAYKPGTEDTRESGSIKVLGRLAKQGAQVSYHDPLVPTIKLGDEEIESVQLDPASMAEFDVVVLLVRQIGVEWDVIASEAQLILDCCNALGRTGDRITRL